MGRPDAVGLDVVRKFMRRSWRMLLAWVLVFLSAAVAFSIGTPSYYTAITTVVMEDTMLRAATENGPGVPDPAYVDTQIQVLQSSDVFTRVLERARAGEFGGIGSDSLRLQIALLGVSWGLLDKDPEVLAERALVTSLKQGLSVRRIGTSNAVEIAFTARNSIGAANGANAFAQEYLSREIDIKEAGRQQMLASFQDRLTELQSKAFAPDQSEQFVALQNPNSAAARAKWRESQATTETYRALYNTTLQRRYAQLLEQVAPRARVITAAEAPESRSWPNTPVVLVLAVAMGLAFGFAHTTWRFATDDVIRSADDLIWASGMSASSCVEETSRRNRRSLAFQGFSEPAAVLTAAALRAAMDRLAIRLFAAAQKRPTNIVAVVSPSAGGGASTIAANLAVSLASAGESAVLLSANWRKARARPDIDSAPGVEIFQGKLGDNEVAPDAIMLRVNGLVAEANASRSLINALGEAASAYRWVVVDLNPLACSADLCAILSDVNFVVLVVRAGQTTGVELDRAAAMIPGDKKVALVLNRASRSDAPSCT